MEEKERRKMNKVLSICIPIFNNWNFTKSCLDDLSKLPNDHEIIIVDNASIDDTENQLKDSKEIIYIRNNENKGFGFASNQGFNSSAGNNVLFLNNDIRVKSNHNNWTSELLKWCDKGLVGPTMGQLDKDLNFVQESNRLLTGNSYMSGWCLASSKNNWNKLEIVRPPPFLSTVTYDDQKEIFNEDFFCYFEDTDLSFRAKQLKMDMIVVDIPVVHFGKVSSKQLNTHQLYSNARKIFVNKWGKNINK